MIKTNTGRSWNDDSDWIENNDLEGYDNYNRSFSDYWLPKMPSKRNEDDIQRLIRLSQIQKSIGNFVRILTGKSNIQVRFHTKSSSYTDGETVTISAKVSDKNFDTSVGLALHEASHCVHTDFNLFKNPTSFIPTPVYERAEKLGYQRNETMLAIRGLFNWIEDRRIDNLTYHTHPGYKGYYASLYTEYFRCKEISEGLKSSEYREETIASYMFRIINLMNENSDLDALRGLRSIYRSIDLKHIGRLKGSRHAFDVAVEVFNEILTYLEIKKNPVKVKIKLSKEQKKQLSQNMPGSGGAQPDVIVEDDSDDEDASESEGSGAGSVAEEDEKESKKSGKSNEKKDSPEKTDEAGAEAAELDDSKEYNEDEVTEGEGKLSDKMKENIEKAMKEIQDLLNGETKKSDAKKDDSQKLDLIGKAGTTIQNVEVAGDARDRSSTVWNVPVTVIRNVTMDYFQSDLCSFSSMPSIRYGQNPVGPMKQYVERGVVLGKMLGRKLQIRNEVKIDKDIRKDHGKVYRRILASVGYGNENIFFRQREDKYAQAILHMSIDSSGSMGGEKLGRAIQTAVAIAKFCDMNPTLNCVVSLRTADSDVPWIAIVYDSRVDKFNKILAMFPYLQSSGSTPEGLCFAAIQKEIESTSGELTSYFLNLSDGEPTHSYDKHYYGGTVAFDHTRRMVENMRSRGVIVLSYFISGWNDSMYNFRQMYGASASIINVDALAELARSLEKMFLEKPKN